MSAEYGRTFRCRNRGAFLMREIIRPGEPTLYVDNMLTLFSPQKNIEHGRAVPTLISPDAEPSEVR